MTDDMRSRVLGMILSSVSRGQFPQREPFGYLYGHVAKEGETPAHTINGVDYVGAVLPKLPEWDREMYPYAAITGRNEKILEIIPSDSGILDVYLFVSAEPFTIRKSTSSSSDDSYYLQDLTNCPYWTFRMGNSPTEWENGYTEYYSYSNRRIYDPSLSYDEFRFMWSNHDIKYLSQVAVAASEPIPVYEASMPIPKSESEYLTFASANPFTIATGNTTRNWKGTLYYSTDTKNWRVWSGSAIESAEHNGEQRIYMCGVGNDALTHAEWRSRWILSGSGIACRGNIETLLDYQMVVNGEHPSMANDCYRYMFFGCTSLTHAPSLNATELTANCYWSMFEGCTSLTQAPNLAAETLAEESCHCMFYGCTSLTRAPALPATTLAYRCYYSMFEGCTSLTQIPALPATMLADSCYIYMFYGCTSLKLSTDRNNEYSTPYQIPYEDTCQEVGIDSLTDMFTGTGGTFTGTPSINTTYYTSNEVV